MRSELPESVLMLHIAAWIWAGYLAALAFMDIFIYRARLAPPVIGYYLVNLAPAMLFLGLCYSKWIQTRLRVMIPALILLISLAPLLLFYLFDLRLPQAPLSNIEGMILRQLPVLFIALVLVAWNYNLTVMLVYSVCINLFDFLIGYLLGPFDNRQLTVFYFLTIIRTISFVVVGIFINQLVARLRAQQEALKAANLELANFARTLETLAVSRERNRLARELHDTLAHTLSGLSVQLEAAKAYWEVQTDTAYELLVNSLTTTRSGLDETRRALKALRASPLDDLGLRLALQNLSETAAERGQLQLELVLPEQIHSISPDVEQCIYRVAQEAIENVILHANADKLKVKLMVNRDELILTVEDNGVGLEMGRAEQAGHYGLAGMRERAELAGGSLAIQSTPGQGTCVQLSVKGSQI
jgi:signal transduction histidine kinase